MDRLKIINVCRLVITGGLLGATGACSVFTPVEVPEVVRYQLTAITPADITDCKTNSNGQILQVTEVKADAPFNNNKMYYSQAPSQLNSYALNEWIAHPDVMLTQAIQEKLLTSCIYSNVVNAEFMTTAKYRLNSQLLDFKQVINGQSATMQLSMLVQLVDNSHNQVIRSKNFTAQVDVDPTPAGYVKGANTVTQTFLTDLTTWLSAN